MGQVEHTIENSICFSAYVGDQCVGFAPIVSDEAVFGDVLDLSVLEKFSGRGVGRSLGEPLLSHRELRPVTWLLGTIDAHGLCEKYGFAVVRDSSRYMRKPFARSRRWN
ncbi:MAG: GNAT family N-acetyltransferase [Halioglobus sp.]|nr:GNAT family N-acetyltransferase [Halioglobus sp.]